jgi:hypothetical protein
LDDRERLLLEPFNLLLGLRDNRIVLCDAVTGDEIGNYVDVCEQLSKAEERIRELETELRRRNGAS